METAEMGRVLVTAKVENLEDLYEVKNGRKTVDQVRSIVVTDALVDTGASTLALPPDLIRQLGLSKSYEKRARTASGTAVVSVYQAVRLTIQDRECTVDVLEVPDGNPVLIGQIPLEFMDFVVDMSGQQLIGNPRHGGEQMFELY